MAHLTTPSIVRQLGTLFEVGSAAALSDRQLIERFGHRRDEADAEAAFAALVARHGPMVLGVCRQLIDDHHLAEDAFQATFLVLARKAHSLRDPDRLATWLYGVALRTARKARARITRQRQHEQGDTMADAALEPTSPPADQALLDREQAEVLHIAIDRLPDTFRSPIVLCYFEGLTLDEAARRLRCPAGTLRSRLARAREKLRRALTRHGVVLSTTAMAAALGPRSAPASVPPHLCDITARAAIRFASRQAAASTATSLAHEVLRTMTIRKLASAVSTLLLVAAFAAGGYLARPIALGDEPRKPSGVVQAPAVVQAPVAAAEKPAPGRMFVVGRVLDPTGKPVANATVSVSIRRRLLFAGGGSEGVHPTPIGHATCDGSGRFRIDAPRSSSAQHGNFGAVAIAPGYGVGWAHLDPDEHQPAAEIILQPEQLIQGRLVDADGQPARGVVVSVWAVSRILPVPPLVTSTGRAIPSTEGHGLWWGRVHDHPGWPRPVTTDDEGRFTLHGIGRGAGAGLSVLDPRFAPQTIDVEASEPAGAKPLKVVLQPARIVTGRVTFADTGRPVPHGQVSVRVLNDDDFIRYTMAEADAEGRFRVRAMAGARLSVSARPPEDGPYLSAGATLEWPQGATERAVDLALPRGVLIRGKVTEEGTGRPVADAAVFFNPYAPRLARVDGAGRSSTRADGSFAFAVKPRPGHLAIQAASEDYQLQVISNSRFYEGHERGGLRMYTHAFIPCDPKPGTEGVEVNVALRPGATARLKLIGPDGQPVRDVSVYGRTILGSAYASVSRTWHGRNREVARNGHFVVHGLDPEAETPVYFLQPDRKLGATAQLSGKAAANGPITVRLEPCGMAMARLVDPAGKPVAGRLRYGIVTMVVTPGPPAGPPQEKAGTLIADEAALSRIDPVNHTADLIADPQGRITLPALIPGASYRIMDRTTVVARNAGDGPQVRKEFTVGPGEVLELGDIRIEKPERLVK